jgi:hypothetical protein
MRKRGVEIKGIKERAYKITKRKYREKKSF